MIKKSTRILFASAITLAVSIGATSVALAQTADRMDDRNVVTDRDSDFDFGWLGLLGLAGLAGLKRREEHPIAASHSVR